MDISVIVPIFNEAGNLPILADKLKKVLSASGMSHECIFVDDGSLDDSYPVLKNIKKNMDFVKVIKLKKNFGQTTAMMAGFDLAKGDIIVTIDADLQNDPEDIPVLISKLNEGFDVVSGWRDKRKDPFFTRKVPSFVANKIISFFTGVPLHDFGCTLKAYKKGVVKNMRLYGEMHRFIPAIVSYSGISIAEIRVRHHGRRYGVSKYGISRILKVLLDLITVKFFLSFSATPMRLFGSVGLISMFLGFIFLAITAFMKFSKGVDVTGNPLFYMTTLMGIIGAQCILMGILGEMNIRIYRQILDNPTYIVEKTLQ